MAAVHDEGLFLGHLAQVLHGEAVLGPVLEHPAVAAVGDEFFGVLRHRGIQIVLDHEHDGRRLRRLCGVGFNGPRVHGIRRAQTVHVNAAVALQLLRKFWGQFGMLIGGEVTQRIAHSQLFFFGRQDVLANRCVAEFGGARLRRGQLSGDSRLDFRLEQLQFVGACG